MYYRIFRDSAGYWRWNLRAGNHEIISVSSEGYARKADAEHGINLNKSSHSAPVYEGQSA